MLSMYPYLLNWLARFERDEEGQDLIEYSLIIVLIVIAAAVGMNLVGTQIATVWTTILNWLNGTTV